MTNTRIRISSSIVSIIIVILGFFMLCMSRAPQINIDEPLVEGGGVEFDSVGVNDSDVMSLLNDTDDSASLTTDNEQPTTTDDNAVLSMLNEENSGTNQDDQSAAAGDEGMDEILRLLESDDSSNTGDNMNIDQDNSTTDFATAEPAENSNQTAGSNSSGTPAMDNLEKEVERLESVLSSKTTEMENLRSEVQSYDQKINDMESRSTTGRSKTPVRQASYTKKEVSSEKSTANERTDYNVNSEVSSQNVSADFEGKYNSAMDFYHRQDYERAIDKFYQLLQLNSRHPLADNCQYWIGECHFAQGKFYQSIADFTRIFAYEEPDKQDDAQLMLGLAFLKLGEINSARIEFDWLVSCYASSEYSTTANQYLSRF